MSAAGRDSAAGRRVLLFGSFAFSQLVLLLILRMPVVPGDGSWLQAFRGYFSFDQLSYAAIASNAATGSTALPEPFTETGHSYYPSLWYRIVGWIAHLTQSSVPAVWTIAGYLLLAGSLVVIGFVAYRISGLAWSPALAGPALCIGTLSIVLHDQWFTSLDSHAVLWGPYGAIYPLNGEVAGFAMLGIALALILRSSVGPALRPGVRLTLLVVAAALIGLTANVHTYVFFVGAAVAFGWAGVYGLLQSRSRGLAIASAVILVLTFAGGSTIAAHVGALPVYGLLLACCLPGAGWLVLRSARTLALPVIVLALAAAPQAVLVASGILAKDEFLTYRQGSSGLLGVSPGVALLATLPIGAVWAFNLAVQRRNRDDVVLASLAGVAFAGIMLTFNNAWGFTQEPYRLWIDSVTVAALLLAPVTAWSIARVRAAQPAGRSFLVTACATAAVVLVAASLLDFGAYRTFVKDSGVISFDTDRFRAMADLTASTDGMLANGPCIDVQQMKIATRKPVAYYNLGIAWPQDKAAIDAVLTASQQGIFSPDAMRAAHVKYLVTDSSCQTQWPVDNAMGIVKVDSRDYSDENGSGTLTLWLIA